LQQKLSSFVASTMLRYPLKRAVDQRQLSFPPATIKVPGNGRA
jgi:hypothetical protein